MDVEINGYERDDKGNLTFTADDVTVTLNAQADLVLIEQPGEGYYPDRIMIEDVDIAEAVAEGLLAWANHRRAR